MNDISMKKNLSSMQVLKTLQVLFQGNFTMQELLEKLNKNNEGHVFNNSVISKYINTCRYCGINILKIHNRYFVASMPFGLELTSADIGLLEKLQNIIKENMSSKNNKIFNNFVDKLNRFSNKSIVRVDKETYQISVELFERAIEEKRKVRLMFKNRNVLDCIPLDMAENNSKTFFHVMYNNKDKMYDTDKVSGIEVLSEKFIKGFSEQVVVFKLSGALAPSYHLRENETIIKAYDGESVTISNRGESKEILLSRLLRYGSQCEIMNPKAYREEMIQILESTLSNYGE